MTLKVYHQNNYFHGLLKAKELKYNHKKKVKQKARAPSFFVLKKFTPISVLRDQSPSGEPAFPGDSCQVPPTASVCWLGALDTFTSSS